MGRRLGDALADLLGAPAFARALSMCAIGTLLMVNVLRGVMGWPGYFAVLATIVLLTAGALAATWRAVEWRGLLPISLLLYAGWCGLSLLWSDYQWSTVGGLAYLATVTFLAVYVGLIRDLIQVIRAFGDVFRFALVLSLVLEVFAGLLIDMPIPFLGVQGNLAVGGPIQGVFGSRNILGVVAVLALVTFAVEAMTRSTTRLVAVGSLALGVLMIGFSRSPVGIGTLLVVTVAALCLLGLRRASESSHRVLQVSLIVALVIGLVAAFIARTPLIALLNAESEFETRYALWKRVLAVVAQRPVEGVGWMGGWRRDIPPYVSFGNHSTALNAYLDAWLQVGIVGLLLLLALLALALVRLWLLGSSKPSVVYIWPPLVLVALIVVSMAESTILSGLGWFILVIVTLTASHQLSWRRRLPDPM